MVIAFIARVDYMGLYFMPPTSHLIMISMIGEEAHYIEISELSALHQDS